MNKISFFQNESFIWPVISIALIIWAIYVWKEWNTSRKFHRYINAFVALISIMAMTMLALKPIHEVLLQEKGAVVLTKGYDQIQLDSLLSEKEGLQVIHYQENKPLGDAPSAYTSIYILGNGIQPFDFWQFENQSVMYLGGHAPKGIIQLKYSKENKTGEYLTVTGKYKRDAKSAKLVLQNDFGEGLDSVALNNDTAQSFKLEAPIKAEGSFVFELLEKDSLGALINRHQVPFEAQAPKLLKVLIMNSAPNFETKYLKNYLADMGHAVTYRTQLTQERYKFEYLNTKATPIYTLRENNLANYNLLIIDANSIQRLSRNGRSAIENTIKNKGLGVFIQPESSMFKSAKRHLGFQFRRDGVSKIVINEFLNRKVNKFPFQFIDAGELEVVHENSNVILAAYKRVRNGRIGTSLIQNTYQWQLEGKTQEYRKFWKNIINALSRRESNKTIWKFANAIPQINEPLEFQLNTQTKPVNLQNLDGHTIALKRNVDLLHLWSGKIYPSNFGWNELHLQDDDTPQKKSYFVFDSISWKSVREYNKKQRNQWHFSKEVKGSKFTTKIAIERIWFFIIAILGLGYLWLQPKLFPN